MLNIRSFFTLGLIFSLSACGGSGGNGKLSSDTTPPPASEEQTTVTQDNIAQAMTIRGAVPANITLPDEDSLDITELTGSKKVLVSANSAFVLSLSVPTQADKQVAGYLIVLPDGSQQFVRIEQAAPAGALALNTYNSDEKIEENAAKKASRENERRVLQAVTDRDGLTRVVIAGWNASGFNLEQGIEGLSIRILPLLVNRTVANVANLSLAQIQAADGFSMSMVQSLSLAVEAVATSAIQLTMTWDTEADIDLYVVEPNENRIYFGNKFSTTTGGWLDRDNTRAYGPENITFGYQLPEGDYKVVVNYYSGNNVVNYSLVVAVNNDEPVIYQGTFNNNVSNGSYSVGERVSETANPAVGNHLVHTFQVDAAFNAQLPPVIPNNQYLGVWQVANDNDSLSTNYLVIKENSIGVQSSIDSQINCNADFSASNWTINFLPSGIRVHNGTLQVSDAFIKSTTWLNDFNYAFKDLTRVCTF